VRVLVVSPFMGIGRWSQRQNVLKKEGRSFYHKILVAAPLGDDPNFVTDRPKIAQKMTLQVKQQETCAA